MICNNNYLADIIRVCVIKDDLIWVMRFQSPKVYLYGQNYADIKASSSSHLAAV